MPVRSACNSKGIDECSKPECVPVRRGGSPHHCRSFPRRGSSPCKGREERRCRKPHCVPVKKDKKFHHCRSPSKKRSPLPQTKSRNTPPPQKKETSPLQTAKEKVWNAIRQSAKDCDTFSLKQRNGTCFMAAATLMFARVALGECKVDSVRKYVRLTMANAWDMAQGPEKATTCPNIPLSIRKNYDLLWHTSFKNNKVNYMNIGIPPHKSSDKEFKSFGRKALTSGGSDYFFLASLFWASGMPCGFTLCGIKFDGKDHNHLATPKQAKGKTIQTFFSDVLSTHIPLQHFNVVAFSFQGESFYAPQETQKVEAIFDSAVDIAASNGLKLEAILLALGTPQKGHVFSIYPCMKGDTKWICCNSWGQDCSKKGLVRVIQDFCSTRQDIEFLSFTFLVRRVVL